MKKLILILILIPSLAFGLSPAIIGNIGLESSAVVCDSCTSNLILTSHFEGIGDSGTEFNITTGDPCGCNTNADKTITYSSAAANSNTQATDGTMSFYRAGAEDYGEITIDALSDVVSIKFDVFVASWANDTVVGGVKDADGNDYFFIQLGTTDEIKAAWAFNGTAGSLYSSGWNLAANTWYTIRVQLSKAGVGGNYVRMTLDGGSAVVRTISLTGWADQPTIGRFGTSGASAGVFYIDNPSFWNNWQTGAAWGD